MGMAKCDTCGKKQYGYLCDGCIHDPSATDKYEPMTNADRIRAMTDEELAEALDDYQDWGGGMSKDWWLKWLQEEAK